MNEVLYRRFRNADAFFRSAQDTLRLQRKLGKFTGSTQTMRKNTLLVFVFQHTSYTHLETQNRFTYTQ